jgi:hypothetical protein
MIGPGGLQLVVPTYLQFQLQFYWWGCQKNTAKLSTGVDALSRTKLLENKLTKAILVSM